MLADMCGVLSSSLITFNRCPPQSFVQIQLYIYNYQARQHDADSTGEKPKSLQKQDSELCMTRFCIGDFKHSHA